MSSMWPVNGSLPAVAMRCSAAVGEPGALLVPAIAHLGGETVIEAGVVVQGDLGMRVEFGVNRRLRVWPDEVIGGRDVQH